MSDPAPEEPRMQKSRRRRHWRGILTELLIVVVGVGLALAAQQTAEWLRWRSDVAQARAVIATEMTENLVSAFGRIRQADCVDRRLDQLGLVLDAAAKTGSLPPLGDIGVPRRAVYPDGAWESVIASQTATHFPRQQLAQIASLYKRLERIREFNSQELAEWNSLFAMVGPGRRLDPASEARLRDAMSQARGDSRSAAYLAATLIDSIRNLHLRFGPDELKRIEAAQHDPSVLRTGVCAPIGAAPASYGQGFTGPSGDILRDILKNPPDFSRNAP